MDDNFESLERKVKEAKAALESAQSALHYAERRRDKTTRASFPILYCMSCHKLPAETYMRNENGEKVYYYEDVRYPKCYKCKQKANDVWDLSRGC